MHRLFVAIRPPGEVRAPLIDLMEGVAGARWQSEDQLHLTLRFIGEVDGRLADDIDTVLQSVRHPRFDIALSGLGVFDRRGQPTNLWAGVSPHEPIKALHKKIDHALERAGVPPERRVYLPHITLARFGKAGGDATAFIAAHGGLTSPPFAVTHFALFESHLGHEAARYEIVERWTLA